MARFVDSSVLVRYLTDDDPERSPVAEEIMESEDLAITTLILHEVAYVLRTSYRYPRGEIAHVLAELIERENIELLDARKEDAIVALRKSEAGRLSFGDALILAQMRTAGCDEIYSFDRGFRDEAIRVLEGPEP